MRATTRTFRLVAGTAAATLLLAACGGDDGGDDASSETTETEAEPTEDTTEGGETEDDGSEGPVSAEGQLVIWADNTRKPALEPFAEEFGTENGIEVTITEKQFDSLRDDFSTAAPAGEGPDIIVGAHDWLGQLVAAGVVAPLDLGGTEGDFDAVAINAMSYEGQLYGLPYAVENIALFRNTDLVPDVPASMAEVQEIALQLEADGEVENGFLIPTDPPDPYHNFPFFTAAGGYVFAYDEGDGYDPSDLGIDSEGGLAAAEQFDTWVEEGFIKPNVAGSLMQEQFGQGDAAFAVSGPWALVQDGAGFTETGVPFEVTPIPPLDGGTPQPFVGVQGFMVSAFSENSLVAQTFLTEAMATEEAQLALFEANSRPPALLAAQEAIGDNETIAAFGESGANGLPLPAIPEMGSVWESWTNAYGLIYNDDLEGPEAFEDAATQIRNLIEGSG